MKILPKKPRLALVCCAVLSCNVPFKSWSSRPYLMASQKFTPGQAEAFSKTAEELQKEEGIEVPSPVRGTKNLQKALANKKLEINQLKTTNASLERKIQELSSIPQPDLKKIQQELTDAKISLVKLENEKKTLQNNLDFQNTVFEENKTLLEKKQQELEQAKRNHQTELNKIKEQLNTLQSSYDAQSKAKASLEQQIRTLEKEVQSYKAKLQDQEKIQQTLRQHQNNQQKLTGYELEIEQLKKTIGIKESVITAVSLSVNTLKNEKERQEEAFQQKLTELENWKQDHEKITSKKQEIEGQLAQLTQECLNLKNQLTDVQTEYAIKINNFMRAAKEKDSSIKSLSLNIEAMKAVQEAQQQELKNKQDQLTNLEENYQQLRAAKVLVDIALTQEQRDVKTLQEQLAELHQSVVTSQASLNNKDGIITSLLATLAQNQQKENGLMQELTHNRASIETLSTEHQKTLKYKDQEIQDLKAKILSLQEVTNEISEVWKKQTTAVQKPLWPDNEKSRNKKIARKDRDNRTPTPPPRIEVIVPPLNKEEEMTKELQLILSQMKLQVVDQENAQKTQKIAQLQEQLETAQKKLNKYKTETQLLRQDSTKKQFDLSKLQEQLETTREKLSLQKSNILLAPTMNVRDLMEKAYVNTSHQLTFRYNLKQYLSETFGVNPNRYPPQGKTNSRSRNDIENNLTN